MLSVAEHRLTYAKLEAENRRLSSRLSELEQLVFEDPLTGISNRRFFDGALSQEISRAHRARSTFALVLLDIDHFKHINDQWGHQVGDQVLRTVAGRLRLAARAGDQVCRIGGEEFGILCSPFGGSQDVGRLGARFLATVGSEAIEPVGVVTVSIGVAVFSGAAQVRWPTYGRSSGSLPSRAAADLYAQADAALYKAKSEGRARVCSR